MLPQQTDQINHPCITLSLLIWPIILCELQQVEIHLISFLFTAMSLELYGEAFITRQQFKYIWAQSAQMFNKQEGSYLAATLMYSSNQPSLHHIITVYMAHIIV